MSDHTSSTERDPTIADLYPHFNEAQRVEAEENLERYLELALRIYERIQADPEAASHLRALTPSSGNPTMNSDRSIQPPS